MPTLPVETLFIVIRCDIKLELELDEVNHFDQMRIFFLGVLLLLFHCRLGLDHPHSLD